MKTAPLIVNLDRDILQDASASLANDASLAALDALIQALNDVDQAQYPPFTQLLAEVTKIFKTNCGTQRQCLPTKLQLQIDGTFHPETHKFQIEFNFLATPVAISEPDLV